MNPESGDNVSAVSVKPPPFWREMPQLWFIRLEAQFSLAHITCEKTKFNYVVSIIDGDIIRVVSDIIRNPHLTEPYTNLKETLIKRLSLSETTKLNQLLSDLNLGDRKPSQLLREMRELGGDKVSEELLRSLWLQRLPENTQSILACNPGNLIELANCADKIDEINNKPNVFMCESKHTDSILEQLAFLTEQVKELKAKADSRDNFRRSRSNSRFRSTSKSPHRQTSRSMDSTMCWYHNRFANRATKCIQPCSFESQSKSKN